MKLYHMAPKSEGRVTILRTSNGIWSLTGWKRKRIKQYLLEWFGIWYLVFGIDINLSVESLLGSMERL